VTLTEPVLAPSSPPTPPRAPVVTATGGPDRRRCAHPGCETVDDLWSMPGGPLCRRHLLEHDARIYGADAVLRRRDEAK
jgi:hypothetical protein